MCVSDREEKFQSNVENSGIYTDLVHLFRGAAKVAESLHLGHSAVLISKSRDRASQVSALAQLLLDAHYRTIEGFIALIEKEW